MLRAACAENGILKVSTGTQVTILVPIRSYHEYHVYLPRHLFLFFYTE